jgi:hypothetical protein
MTVLFLNCAQSKNIFYKIIEFVPIKFLKIILPHILPYVIHIFNTILMSSSYPASWKFSKIMPVAKTNDPGSLSDYRPISILPKQWK